MKIKKITSLIVCVVMLMSLLPLETAFAGAYISWRGDAFSAEQLYYDDYMQSWVRTHGDGEYITLYDTSGNKYYRDNVDFIKGLDDKGTKLVGYHDGTTKIIDKNGNLVKDFGKDYVTAWNGYIERYKDDGSYSVYNAGGRKIVSDNYSYVNPVAKNRLVAYDEDYNVGMIDGSGKKIIPTKYQSLNYISDERIIVKNSSGYYGIIDANCNVILPCAYTALEYISDRRILASKKQNPWYEFDRIIYIDGTKRMVAPEGYVIVGYSSDDFIELRDNNYNYKFVNISGYRSVPKEYTGATYYSDKFIKVCKDGKWGAIDVNGNKVLECKYDSIYYYSDNVIEIWSEEGSYIKNVYGQTTVSKKYSWLDYYEDDFIIAHEKDGRSRIIDSKGNTLYGPVDSYLYAMPGDNGSIAVSLGDNMYRICKLKYN